LAQAILAQGLANHACPLRYRSFTSMGTCFSQCRGPQYLRTPKQSAQLMGPLEDPIFGYTSKQDRSHLRLGICKEGMLLLLEKVGLSQWTGRGERVFEGDDAEDNWNYDGSYTRDPGLASWLDNQVGTVKKGNVSAAHPSGGLKNVTGCDLAEYIRKWQREKHVDHLSVCEIILVEPEFQDLRQYVGIANVFWSHIQMESFLGSSSTYHDQNEKREDSTLYMLNNAHRKFQDRLPPKDSCFYWLDYFCLRQCKSDVEVQCTIELIKDIGNVVSAIDTKFEYIKRPFCILELYAAVQGNSNLMCLNGATSPKYTMCLMLAADRAEAEAAGWAHYWVGSITVEAAQTRRDQDKQMIDGFIKQLPGGFDAVNNKVTEALLEPLR